MMRKLVYYVGMSIDGFIAGPDDEVDFYPATPDVLDFIVQEHPDTLPTHLRAQWGVEAPNQRFDACVMGLGTYRPALEMGVTSPYAHLRQQVVVSGSLGESPDPSVEVVSSGVERIRELKAQEGRDIYLVGGGVLAGALLSEIDELVLKVYPVVAGEGRPLFRTGFSPTTFTLVGTRVLESGTVILTYSRGLVA